MNRLAFITIGLVLFSLTLYPQSQVIAEDYNLKGTYADHISLANKYIYGEKAKFYWEPATKTMVNLLYSVGFTAARFGGRYIILESPSLAVDMVKGGGYTLSNIAYDGLLEIVKQAVKSPDKVCIDIAQSTKREGVRSYNIAYEIAQKQKETGRITEEEADLFLRSMWTSLKCAAARTLYIESQEEYSIDELIAEKTVDEILEQLEPLLEAKLEINNQLPLIDAAIFIKDLSDILESKKIGLASYPPYINYVKNITNLNTFWLNEFNKIGGDDLLAASERDEYLFIPGKSVGPINFNTTINDLYQFYGKENVETSTGYYEGEGTELATETIITNRGLKIRWKDQVTHEPKNPILVTIDNSATDYHSMEGIKIGTTLQELSIINGKPIDYRDPGTEPCKVINDWQGGILEKYGREISNAWMIKLDYDELDVVGISVVINDNQTASSPEMPKKPQAKLLTLLSPKGGESWQKGQKIRVAWEVSESPGSLNVMLESDVESKLLLGYNIIKSGSTMVSIPYTIKNGNNWHILLVGKSPSLEIRVKSGNFSIGGEEYISKDVVKDYPSDNTALSLNLISYWKIDESSGGVAYDSYSTNHCSIQSGVSINQDGLIGRAASFIETSGGLTTNKLASQLKIGGNTSKSVSLWIKPSSSLNGANSCGIISIGLRANQQQFGIKYYGNPAYWMFDSWYGAVRIGPDNVKLDDGHWHHLVVTYNSGSSTVKTYLDGRFVTSDDSKSLNTGDQMVFSIGIGSQGKYTGLIDEVGLWGRELSDNEVQLLYNRGLGLSYEYFK